MHPFHHFVSEIQQANKQKSINHLLYQSQLKLFKMDRHLTLTKTTTYLRYLLTVQLLLGGQARLTSLITPGAHDIAMSKACELQRYVPIPFISDPQRHSELMGVAMLVSGGMLCVEKLRVPGAVVAGGVLGSWVYGFWRMGVEWWLPLTNCVVVGMVVWGEMV